MPTMIVCAEGSASCGIKYGEQGDPDLVLLQLLIGTEGKRITLHPTDALALGEALIADARQCMSRSATRGLKEEE